MLYTLKQTKISFSFMLNFGQGASNPESSKLSFDKKISKENISSLELKDFIFKNKTEITSWVKKNSWNDKKQDYIGFMDLYNWESENHSWNNLLKIAHELKVSLKWEINVNELLTAINNYAGEKKEVISTTKKEIKNDKLIWKLSEQNSVNLWEGRFKDSRKNKVVDSQVQWDLRDVFDWKRANTKQVLAQIEKTGQAMDDARARIIVTKVLNWNLKNYFWEDKKWYSIYELVEGLFGKDKVWEFAKNKENFEKIIRSNPKRFEEGVGFLTGKSYDPEKWAYTGVESAKNFISKAYPWLIGIYLWDIPLPLMKEMSRWADVNKSQAFNKWIESWMKESFEQFYNGKKWEILNPLKEQVTLRAYLSTLKLDNKEQVKILSWNLNGLNQRTENLLLDYLKEILIPNLKIMSDESFNSFEKGKWYTLGGLFGLAKDKKYPQLEKIINGLESAVAKWDLDNSKAVSEAFKLLAEEWDVSNVLGAVESWDKYMNKISEQNKDIQEKLKPLFELGTDKYNTYSKIYKFENIEDFKQKGLNESDFKSMQSLMGILNKSPISARELSIWERNNPSTFGFIKALGDSKAMESYLLRQTPKTEKLKKVSVESRGAHGRDLSKLSNVEALRAAETEKPAGSRENLSTLALAYRSVVKKLWLSDLTYDEFRTSFANKSNVNKDSISWGAILNTWRWEKQAALTSAEKLKVSNKEGNVFKLAPIEKNYTYYDEGQLVNIKTSYTIYMRPDCTNPLVVPNTIKVEKAGKPVENAELISLIQTPSRLPVVIPYFLIGKWFGGKWGNWGHKPEVWTKPGERVFEGTVWNTWASSWTLKPAVDVSNIF